MSIKEKTLKIFLETIPIIIMIGLIPLVENDYVLAGIYALIVAVLLFLKRTKKDWLFLVFGFVVMTLAELFFISTGVEKFERNSLFGLMPLWLPFLWAYVFVVMRRAIVVLDR